jgi:hypothetical protein
MREGNKMRLKFVSENEARGAHTAMDRSNSRISTHLEGTGILIGEIR